MHTLLIDILVSLESRFLNSLVIRINGAKDTHTNRMKKNSDTYNFYI